MKQTLKRILPPLLLDAVNYCRNGFRGFYIWKGVYQKYIDVPISGNSYFSPDLSADTEEYTKYLLERLNKSERIPKYINEENTFLPLVAALIFRQKEKVKILDLGGGMGIGFISLLSCLENIDLNQLEYYIIETPTMCQTGSVLFKNEKRIHFLTQFPSKLENVTIVYINSALQYFEKYQETLKQLTSYNPEYFLFLKFSAGDIPTYATEQRNLKGTTSAYWFFNVDEIVFLMSSLGYTLYYKSTLGRVYHQENFPASHRLSKACNLLFIKTDR